MVSRHRLLSGVVSGATLIVSLAAMSGNAAMVYLSPSSVQVGTGSCVSFDLIANGLTGTGVDGTTEFQGVSVFNLTLEYDPEILSFVKFTTSGKLGTMADVYPFIVEDNFTGTVNLDVCSEATSQSLLDVQQAGIAGIVDPAMLSVKLGTVTFRGVSEGTTILSFAEDGFIGNVYADLYETPDLGATASVQVPEPSAISLALFGLLSVAMVGIRKRK